MANEFDPARLAAQKQLQDEFYARLRLKDGRARDAHVRLQHLKSRAAAIEAELNALLLPTERAHHEHQLAALQPELTAAQSELEEAREKAKAASDEWATVARLYERCVAFARDRRIPLPPVPLAEPGPQPDPARFTVS